MILLERAVLVEDFEARLVYPFRIYERHPLCFSVDGKFFSALVIISTFSLEDWQQLAHDYRK